MRPNSIISINPFDSFQSTHLLRGATWLRYDDEKAKRISIHAPLARCDPKSANSATGRRISIHAPLARCDEPEVPGIPDRAISIHAPLARCDVIFALIFHFLTNFNPRTSCEVRPGLSYLCLLRVIFQSTHLLRGATLGEQSIKHSGYISIHAPLARCDDTLRGTTPHKEISIHAPLARCDYGGELSPPCHRDFNPRTSCEVRQLLDYTSSAVGQFQSTHLLRGATCRYDWTYNQHAISIHAPLARCDRRVVEVVDSAVISIHAPLARCDRALLMSIMLHIYFNPRTSCEVRPAMGVKVFSILRFQSTHLLRGATYSGPKIVHRLIISIHAPLARCDCH